MFVAYSECKNITVTVERTILWLCKFGIPNSMGIEASSVAMNGQQVSFVNFTPRGSNETKLIKMLMQEMIYELEKL